MYVYIEQISLMRHKLDRIDRLGHAACWRCYNAACCARHSPAWICQLCLQCADTRVAFRLQHLPAVSIHLSQARIRFLASHPAARKGALASQGHTLHTAMDTPRIAFAPSLDLSLVPSRSISFWSMLACWVASVPCGTQYPATE